MKVCTTQPSANQPATKLGMSIMDLLNEHLRSTSTAATPFVRLEDRNEPLTSDEVESCRTLLPRGTALLATRFQEGPPRRCTFSEYVFTTRPVWNLPHVILYISILTIPKYSLLLFPIQSIFLVLVVDCFHYFSYSFGGSGNEETGVNYFQEIFGYDILYPDLQALIVRENDGQTTLMPIEVRHVHFL